MIDSGMKRDLAVDVVLKIITTLHQQMTDMLAYNLLSICECVYI